MADFFEIEDSVFKINTPLGDVFVSTFIVVQNRSAVLIDTGLKDTFQTTRAALKKLNIPFNHVNAIVNTHSHHDHIGANSALKDLCGCCVVAHRLAGPWMENHELQYTEFLCRFPDELLPDEKQKQFFFENLGRPAVVDQKFENSIEIQCDSRMLRCFHTPGHSADCIAIHDEKTGSIFTGDSLMGAGVGNALPQYDDVPAYRRTIGKIRNINPSNIFSAHFESKSGAACQNFLDGCEHAVSEIETAINEIIKSERKASSRLEIAEFLCSQFHKTLTVQTLYTVSAHMNS